MSFTPKINNAPIYKIFQQDAGNAQSNTDPNWQRYLNQINNKLNISNNYGNPSVCLNSDFYWNNGVASPISSNGFISEKWQISTPGGTVFTVTQTPYDSNSANPTGSKTYLNIDISSYSGVGDGSDLYIYQRQTGSEFLRRYQNTNISMSIQAITSDTNSITTQLQMYTFYDPSNATQKGGASAIDSSTQYYSTTFLPPVLSSESVGAGAYVEFRLAILTKTPFSPLNFNLNYIKAEMADISSTLYVDHALERARIDNS